MKIFKLSYGLIAAAGLMLASCVKNELPSFSDGDAFVAIQTSTASVAENAGKAIEIPVLLTSLSGISGSVDFVIEPDSAKGAVEGVNYKLGNASKTLTFTKDAPSQSIIIEPIDNNTFGGDVKFTIKLSNAQGDCLHVDGGIVEISYCTLAQFYPFTGGRGAALYITNHHPLFALSCLGSILTGYDDDVLMGNRIDDDTPFNYIFSQCLLRTPAVDEPEQFSEIIWETPEDSIQGKAHFIKIDEDNLDYDFHLDSLSTAIGLGCYR